MRGEKGAHAPRSGDKKARAEEEKIADSESVSARPFNDADNGGAPMSLARKKKREKVAKDMTKKSNVSLFFEIKNGGQTIGKREIDRLAAAKITRSFKK